MSESNAPNLGAELLRIHSIITRGLQVGIEHSRLFFRQGYPSTAMREGFVCYIRSLISVLDAHHHTEDQLAFPCFKEKFPEAPFEQLTAEHQVLVPLLHQAKTIVDEMDARPEDEALLNTLSLLLKKIDELWHSHIRIEEEYFTVEKIRAAIPPEEQARLNRLFAEHSQQHAKPDFLIVPFLLYNLTPEHRAAFASAMPPMVVQQLVPVGWKEKWAPMKPFLIV